MKNLADARFFTPDVCAARRPKHPVIPSEKTPSRISPRVPLLRAAWPERVKNRADAPQTFSGFHHRISPIQHMLTVNDNGIVKGGIVADHDLSLLICTRPFEGRVQ